MRVCLIANMTSPHARRQLAFTKRMGHEVQAVHTGPDCPPPEDADRFVSLASWCAVPKIRMAVWAALLRPLLSVWRPEIVHAFPAAGPGWLGAAVRRRPYVITAEGSDLLLMDSRPAWQGILTRRALGRADHVVCVSRTLCQKAGELGVPEDRRSVIWRGVDTSVFCPPENDPRPRADSAPRVFFPRPLFPVYNPETMAETAVRIHRLLPGARMVFFSNRAAPAALDAFRNALARGGAEGSAAFIGRFLSDKEMAEQYRAADVTVSLSLSDSTPKSVQEAMACGSPCVLGDIPAFQDWARDGENALLAPVMDADAAARAVARLVSAPPLAARVSACALRFIRENAREEETMSRLPVLYERLIKKAKRATSDAI
jgi:glycosyltransferase involved in cell wall biosynthesis